MKNKSSYTNSFQQKLDYLYALDGKGIKPGLTRILTFLDKIGNPQKQLKVIHIAGTNGKGSTCAMLSAVLEATGLKVGLYTSPHLVNFNERIRINGIKISNEAIIEFLDGHRDLIEEIDTTFFETTTALAFDYFAKNTVDILILETGLGGRFDATNVVTPILSVITPIGKDHEEFLGHDLHSIALEKAGIIKPEVPIVSARQRPQIKQIFLHDALDKQSKFIYAPDSCRIKILNRYADQQVIRINSSQFFINDLKFPLIGDHQIINLETVFGILDNLKDFPITIVSILSGLSTTCWHGRLEIVSKRPLVYYDVGHNLHGIRQVVRTIQNVFKNQKFIILLAMGNRKRTESLGKVLAKIADRIIVSEIPDNKSIPAHILAENIKRDYHFEEVIIEPDISVALPKIVNSMKSTEKMIILGSHYFASVVYNFFKINV